MRIMMLNQSPRNMNNPNDSEYHERVQALLNGYGSPGTSVELHYPDDHPGAAIAQVMSKQRARSELNYFTSTPALIRKAVWAEQNGFDAVIQSNNFEPGVEATRFAVRIPVIGLCRTTIHYAANFAERVGVTVPFDEYALLTRRLLRQYDLERFVTEVRTMSLDDVPHGDDVARMRPIILERAAEVMHGLIKETGAQVIVPLGGAVIPYIVDPRDLEKQVGVTVFNPKVVGIRVAEMAAEFGYTHSDRAYPPAKLQDRDFDAYLFTNGRVGAPN
jgi:Asp/Glu/hydantoin racemase